MLAAKAPDRTAARTCTWKRTPSQAGSPSIHPDASSKMSITTKNLKIATTPELMLVQVFALPGTAKTFILLKSRFSARRPHRHPLAAPTRCQTHAEWQGTTNDSTQTGLTRQRRRWRRVLLFATEKVAVSLGHSGARRRGIRLAATCSTRTCTVSIRWT